MTVSTTGAEAIFPGTGSQTVFSVAFSITGESDVVVLLRDGATDTSQVLNVNYTLTGVGGASGFTVTMAEAPEDDQFLVVYRTSPKTQETNLTETGGFNLSGIMAALDRQTRLIQETIAQIDRSLRVRVGETPLGEIVSGTAEDRANRTIVFTDDGLDLAVGPTVDEISNAQTAAESAAASASSILDLFSNGSDTAAPSLLFTGINTGMVYSSRQLSWTRIGRLVYVYGSLKLTLRGSSTGEAALSGLPFAADLPDRHVIELTNYANMGAAITGRIFGVVVNSSIILYKEVSGGSVTPMLHSDFLNNSSFHFSGSYITLEA